MRPQGERYQAERGVPRAGVQPLLQEQGQHEEQAGAGGDGDQAHEQSGSETPVLHERGLDERVGRGALTVGEGGQEQAAGDDRGDGDGAPAVGRALDQAVQQPEDGCGEQAGGPAVDDGGPVAVVVTRQDLDGHDQPDNAKDDVDEEDRAPGQTEHVGADEESGQDRAADTGQTENRADSPNALASMSWLNALAMIAMPCGMSRAPKAP